MMIACPACNQSNPDGNRFCGMCGAKLERRRTPDSELLPEDSERSGPAAEMPARVAAPVQQRPLNWGEPAAPAKLVAAEPLSQEQPRAAVSQEAPRAAAPASRSTTAVAEPMPAGSYMGFSLASDEGVGEAQKSPAIDTRDEAAAGYSVSGPSFLGLSEGQSKPEYLLEEEETRHGARNWFLGIVVLIGILAYGQWRANGRGQTLFAGLPAIRAPKPVLSSQAAAPAAKSDSDDDTPDMDVAPTNADLKPQTSAKKDDAATTTAPAGDAKAPQQAADSNPQAKPEQQASNSPKTDTPAESAAAKTDGKPTETAADDPADDSDAKPEAASAAAKRSPRLEKTKAPAQKAKAAKADASASMLAEGQRYLYGQGVRKSCEQAVNLIHSAANQGNAEARAQLGGMYATGNCAPFDRVTAYRWFSLALAASPRNNRVQSTRDMLWREMTDTERQRARNLAE